VRQQVIYAEGSSGQDMYMLLRGELEITVRGERLGFLSDGAFFGETPVLDHSSSGELRRRTVTAMTDCKLCFLNKHAIKELGSSHPELALRLRRCTRTEAKVNKKGRRYQEAMRCERASERSVQTPFSVRYSLYV
jgi:CRP-like cAMP-binding protein